MKKLTEIYIESGAKKAKKVYQPVRTVRGSVRIKHYILDLFFIFLVAFLVFGLLDSSAIDDIIESRWFRLYTIGFVAIYYFAFELLFRSTPGKMITKCMVVNEYGKRASVFQVLARSVIRLIPLEQFRCLGDTSYGWHDKWSKTYVVEIQDLEWMLGRLQEQEKEEHRNYDALITP